MAGELEQLLNEGLSRGYAGKTEIEEGWYGSLRIYCKLRWTN